MIALKRVYDPISPDDGERVLVDRLWPRGLSRASAGIVEWAKDLAPSDALRRWYGSDTARWPEFRRRYLAELAGRRPQLEALAARGRAGRLTLVYAKSDRERNNAVVLREALEGLAAGARGTMTPRRRPAAGAQGRTRPARRAAAGRARGTAK
jgi:uncharacterized protein YeaO (DUF488 family)